MNNESELASAVYEGSIRHRRHAPRSHAFCYRVTLLYLDLAELDRVFAGRWLWSVDRSNLAAFHRRDYLGPAELPLDEAVRRTVERALDRRPEGPIRVLTHPRYAGYVFNPVSFYYCHDASGELDCIVAEITNTPWGERHAYVLPVAAAERDGDALEFRLAKDFHVSPFLPMDVRYVWRFSLPGRTLGVHMRVIRGARDEFDATLALERRSLDAAALRRALVRYPLMTAKVTTAIYWQALRLWLGRTPVYPHPQTPPRNA